MKRLGDYLLKLSRGALEKPAHEFKDWAIAETKRLIPFDSCVWGTGTLVGDNMVVHGVHLHRLGGNFIESLLRFQHEDRLTRDIYDNSNRTFNIDVPREYAGTGIYDVHCREFGIEHILATGTTDPDTRILNTIVFYRSDIGLPYTEAERALKEIVFPHLIEAARTNWVTNLPTLFHAHQRRFYALAACDDSGLLHVSMPSFVTILRSEWASWNGPFLPQEVREAMRLNHDCVGKNVVVSIIKVSGTTLLRARPRFPADGLGARELEIARQIADGQDYKTIAGNLGISPATVKTHTANIYAKLGVNDKAKVAAELSKAHS